MRRMDEMEISDNTEAIKWGWRFSNLALLFWGLFVFFRTRAISPVWYILIFQNAVWYITSLIFKWKSGDNDGRKQMILFPAGVIFFLILFSILIHYLPK